MRVPKWMMLPVTLAATAPCLAQTTEGRSAPAARPCAGCVLTARRVLTIGSASDSVLPDYLSPVARANNGFYYVGVGSMFGKNRIAVYDSAGRLVRSVGRPGQGPGEFAAITQIVVTRGDTVHVIEASGRHSLLSPHLTFIRLLTPFPSGVASITALSDGRLAAITDGVRTPSVRQSVHVYPVDGGPPTSFHPSGASVQRGVATGIRHAVAAARTPGHFWAAHTHRYRLELWNDDGVLQRALELPRGELGAWGSANAGLPHKEKPSPKVLSVSEHDGYLWVRVGVAASTWKPSATPPPRGSATSPRWYDQYYDTVIDVLAPGSGALLHSLRVSAPLNAFLNDGTIYGAREDDDGIVLFDIWRMELAPPR
jgi:hypothetical protein